MKLYGYIKSFRSYSFAIPIYRFKNEFFYHNLDDDFKIISFTKTEDTSWIIPLTKLDNVYFKVGNTGIVVFIGEGNTIYKGIPQKTFYQICQYLDRLSRPRKYISQEIFKYAAKLNIDLKSYLYKFKIKCLLRPESPNQKIILELIKKIETQTKKAINKRKRKSSFKHLKKGNKLKRKADSKKIENLKTYIVNYLKIGNFEKAFNETQRLLKYQFEVSPMKFTVKSLTDISSACVQNGLYTEAKLYIYFAKLIPVKDSVPDCQYAEILKNEGNLTEAKRLYEQIQRDFPNNVVARNGYAEVLKSLGNLNEAKRLYEQIQRDFPSYVVTRTGYAEVLKSLGNLNEAKKMYEQIQRDFPSNVVARNGYAEVLKSLGNLNEAKRLYEQIQNEFPYDIVARTGYAEVLKSLGNLNEAKKMYEQIQRDFPNNVVAKNGYVEVLKSLGNLNEAKRLYEQIQNEFPSDVVARNGYAEVLKSLGNLNEAKRLYKQIQRDFPNNVIARTGYAEVLKSQGNLNEAKRLYEQIQNEFPSDVVVRNGYAEVLKSQGNLNEAKRLYEQIQRDFPYDLVSKHSLLTCQLLLRDKNANLIEITNPKTEDDYYFYHSSIMFHILRGETSRAKELLLNTIEKIPFKKSKDVYQNTLKLIILIENKFGELTQELLSNVKEETTSPVDNVFNTHILAKAGQKEKAQKYFEIIKKYPEESIIYKSATLLNELYNLNGLPKKNVPQQKLEQLLVESELLAIVAF